MEKLKINDYQAISFVKEALVFLEYPDNLEIISFKGEANQVFYQASYEKVFQGKTTKFLMPINRKNFIHLMTFGMNMKGYEVAGINILVKENEISYEAMVDIVSYWNNPKRNRRRN